RPDRRRAAHARGDRPDLRRDPRADPPDRGQDAGQAAWPLLRRPAEGLPPLAPGAAPTRPARPFVLHPVLHLARLRPTSSRFSPLPPGRERRAHRQASAPARLVPAAFLFLVASCRLSPPARPAPSPSCLSSRRLSP